MRWNRNLRALVAARRLGVRDAARLLAVNHPEYPSARGLHFRHSMLDGERLGRRVARHVTHRHFRPRCQRSGSRP